MKEQSSRNYLRFYPAHHFIFYPIIIAVIVCSAYFANTESDFLPWIFIATTLVLILFLSLMLRQHYALTLQDRIIRLELRYRYFAITGQRLEEYEARLSDSQLFSLRFCSDAELAAMVQLAVNNNLSASDIKKSIISWQPDIHRV